MHDLSTIIAINAQSDYGQVVSDELESIAAQVRHKLPQGSWESSAVIVGETPVAILWEKGRSKRVQWLKGGEDEIKKLLSMKEVAAEDDQ